MTNKKRKFFISFIILFVLIWFSWKYYYINSTFIKCFPYADKEDSLFDIKPTKYTFKCKESVDLNVIKDTLLKESKYLILEDSSSVLISPLDFVGKLYIDSIRKEEFISIFYSSKNDINIFSSKRNIDKHYSKLSKKYLLIPRIYKSGFFHFKFLDFEGFQFGDPNIEREIIICTLKGDQAYEFYFKDFTTQQRICEFLVFISLADSGLQPYTRKDL